MAQEIQTVVACPKCRTENATARTQCKVCGTPLHGTPPAGPVPREEEAAVANPPEAMRVSGDHLVPGQVIRGTWRIARFLGEGGAGSVHVAEHVGLGHHVAIKTLLSRYVRDATMKRRFKEEAIIQANVVHPNILRVNDVVDEPGLCAIVMEYADGGSLESWLERHPDVDLDARVHLFLGILDGVGAAHAEGIVHRDLKPANVLIDSSGGRIVPKVTDFGIAKIVAEGKRTETGMTMGTMHYAAPEQLTDAKSVDHRADIYALGCTLYELVTGEVPFERDSMFALMRAHLEAPRPDASQRNPRVSRALSLVIKRAMAIDPEHRYPSCAAFSADLREAAALVEPVGTASLAALAPVVSSGPRPATRVTGASADASASPAATPRTTGGRGATLDPDRTTGGRARSPRTPGARTETPQAARTGRATTASRRRTTTTAARGLNGVQIAIVVLAVLVLVAGVVALTRPKRPMLPGEGADASSAGAASGTEALRVDGPVTGVHAGTPAPQGTPHTDRGTPPEVAAVADAHAWDVASCRAIADRYLEFTLASNIPVAQAIDELDAASQPCRDLFASRAEGEYERLTGLLTVDQIRYAFHHLRALREDASRFDPCADAMMAASELQRGLRRVFESIEAGFLMEYEVASVSTRRTSFAQLHRGLSERWPHCTVPPLPAELDPLPPPDLVAAEKPVAVDPLGSPGAP